MFNLLSLASWNVIAPSGITYKSNFNHKKYPINHGPSQKVLYWDTLFTHKYLDL